MTTRERAKALAQAFHRFPELSPPDADALLLALRLELGHENVLDGFQRIGPRHAIAVAPRCILNIVSSNTPHAALQAIARSLLLGSRTLVKLPKEGLGDFERFTAALPRQLAASIECSRTLHKEWEREADAWVVYGNDETIREFRGRCPLDKKFLPFGPRVSLSVIFDDPRLESCDGVARDVSLFEQQGCLSPQVVFVANDAAGYAAQLASAMEAYHSAIPSPTAALPVLSEVRRARDTARFELGASEAGRIWCSSELPGWTVIHDERPVFRDSPLHRFIRVCPLPADLAAAMGSAATHIGAIAIHPATLENASRVSALRPSRICACGRMQDAPIYWHAEGRANFSELVEWIDFEPLT